MRRTNLAVSLGFLALGMFLMVSAYGFPAGMGRLPGPGFFPAVIGLVTTALALLLLPSAFRPAEGSATGPPNWKAVGATVVLTAAYLLLWGIVPFAFRTTVFLVILLRGAGQSWRASVTVAVVLAMFVLVTFQYGLRVDLG